MNTPINTIFWDLSGTLLKPVDIPEHSHNEQNLSLLLYLWGGKKTIAKEDAAALHVLDQSIEPIAEFKIVKVHTGKPLPTLTCLWLTGKLSSQECLAFAHRTLNGMHPPYSAKIRRMLEALFDPSLLAHCMRPIIGMTKNLAFAATQTNATQYILSNWDPASFAILVKLQQQTIFTYIKPEHILISGNLGYLKPQQKLYDLVFSRFALKPEQCLFIDDQEENIAHVKKLGAQGIQFTNENYQYVKEEIIRLVG